MINRNQITIALSLMLLSTGHAQAAVTCTASPDCSVLGYTKTAADCPGGSVKCPFDKTKLFCLQGGGGNVFAIKNKVNNLDIVYSDGTTSSSLTTTKDAIGVALVFETNSGYNHGIIVSAHQPPATTWANAIKRCNDFVVKGTSEGDWRLPTLFEMIEINGWETESSTGTNQYTNLNNKMKLLPQAEQLGYSYLYNYCNSGANDNGGTYLKESPMCTDKTNTVSFVLSDLKWYETSTKAWEPGCASMCGSAGMGIYSASSNYNKSYCTDKSNFSGSKSCPTCSASRTLISNYYWTISETPNTNAYPYYFKLGATNQEKVIKGDSSSKTKKLLYRCVMTF